MKKILLVALACVSFLSFSAEQNRDVEKLKVEINKNAELLGLAYFIGFEGENIGNETVVIEGKEIPKKEWHRYGYSIYEKYKSYATSENLAIAFSVADHLWLDYILNLLAQVQDFPNAALVPTIDKDYYINFSKSSDIDEAKKNATLFLEGLNKFYIEIAFDQYLLESKRYYEAALDQVRNNLTDTDFIEAMESFYNRSFESYTLIPSLTIPKGMGFGLRYTINDKTHIFNIFGAFDMQNLGQVDTVDMGFANSERLRELSVHEFGHSFVNPVVDTIEEEQVAATEKLFLPIQSAMSDQNYITWKACLYEHFVRAGEVVLAKKTDKNERSEQLRSWYIEDRKFIYLPLIIEELERYDRGETKTYLEAVNNSIERLAKMQ